VNLPGSTCRCPVTRLGHCQGHSKEHRGDAQMVVIMRR
jgi:hypothetical protein